MFHTSILTPFYAPKEKYKKAFGTVSQRKTKSHRNLPSVANSFRKDSRPLAKLK